MTGLILAGIAVGLLIGGIALWMRLISRVEIDSGRRLPSAMIATALVLSVIALTQSPGLVGGILAGLTATMGSIAVVLQVLAPQSKQEPAIAVGQVLPAFTALDHEGKAFDLASLNGRPILMKFFRGHW
ncbi:MAG: hypothetical protein ABGX04_13575 [Myxococcales bacterium]|jgi:hypothetical protein|nr:hypothetical protein [Myxococcales bacterium]HIK85088.1 hypothetical protein [Myxococcales bacterium]